MNQSRYKWFKRQFTLSDQFFLISFIILLGGMLFIGWWVGSRIESAVLNQTASLTGLYLKSFVVPLLQPLATNDKLDKAAHEQLQNLITNTPLGEQVVSVKVWSREGTILFSLEPILIGQHFTPDADLLAALRGETISQLTTLGEPQNVAERRLWATLIETYVPVYATGHDQVIGVVQFYQLSEPLLDQINRAKQQSWLVVGGATMLMYLLLSGLVAQGSRTIADQQAQLQQSINDLAALLKQNQGLRHRLQLAAARTTEINEQLLHRVGRDLHDGPAQDVSLALLRLDDVCKAEPAERESIRHALHSALHEIRALASGLQLPELEPLETAEVVRRAVREFQRKTGGVVDIEINGALPPLSLSKKIAVYRLIAEALHNSYRHAGGKGQRVKVTADERTIGVVVSDQGSGFDLGALKSNPDHLGIAGLQQRIALLAGVFEIQSSPDTGTRVSVTLPLQEG